MSIWWCCWVYYLVVNMIERPILFSAPMVRALLDGRKTQTRRVVKCPSTTESISWRNDHPTFPDGYYTGWSIKCDAPLLLPIKCPYGNVGDQLWGRENFRMDWRNDPHGKFLYRADLSDDESDPWKWKPSIHMPRAASRISLEIKDVRVERLKDISEEDARAEGWGGYLNSDMGDGVAGNGPRTWFNKLWTSINGPESWAANPFVWVVEFERIIPPQLS